MADKSAEQLQARVTELEAELEKQRGIVANAEKKFNDWSNERGDERKSVAEIAKALKDAVTELRENEKKNQTILAELADAKQKLAVAEAAKSVPPGLPGGGEKPKTVDEQIAEIALTLTEDETGILDKALEAATPEEQDLIRQGGVGYLKFLQAFIRNARKPEAVLPPWRKKPASDKGKKAEASDLDRLFRQAKKSAEQYPDGHNGGTPRVRRQAVDRPPVTAADPRVRASLGIESE